ncbi:MAG: hypothetical protein AMXMBFR64_35670 [Myxococcales bacterium]
MRRLLIVAGLLALPLLAPWFVPGRTLGADGAAVGALGLLLLAAFVAAELTAAARATRVMGAVLAGLLLGPAGLVVTEAQADLEPLRDLAGGLLALLAGATVPLRGGRRWVIAATQIVACLLILGPLTATLAPALPSFTGATPGVLALAGLLGALVLSFDSPLATVAARLELRATGKVSDAAQALSVGRTTGAAALCLVALGAVRIGAEPEGLGWATSLAVTAGGAVAAAGIISLWLHRTSGELVVLLVGALGAAAAARLGGADPVLMLLLTGLLVRAWCPEHEVLAHLAERASYPAALVLFALAGATVDTSRLPALGALAATLAAVRVLVLLSSTMLAARATQRLPARALAGTQLSAGVLAIGAAGGVAALPVPWAADLGALLALTAAIGLLTGLPVLRAALDRAGETERARRAQRRTEQTEPDERATAPHAAGRPAIPEPEGLHPNLDRILAELRNRLFDIHERFVTDVLDERLHDARRLAGTLRGLAEARLVQLEDEVMAAQDAEQRDTHLRRAAEEIARDWRDAVAWHAASLQERGPETGPLLALVRSVEDLVLSMPPVRIPIRDAAFERLPDDPVRVRLRKLAGRLRIRLGARLRRRLLLREVPLARLGRVALSGPLPLEIERTVAPFLGHRTVRLWQLLVEAHEDLGQRLQNAEGTQAGGTIPHTREAVRGELDALVQDLETYRDEIADRMLLALGSGFAELLRLAAIAGTPLLPRRETDPSRIWESNRQARDAISDSLDRWWLAARGASGALMLRLDVAAMRRGALTRTTEAATRLRGTVGRTLLRQPRRLLTECTAQRNRLDATLTPGGTRAAMQQALDGARDVLVAAADTAELERIRDQGGLHGLLAEVHRNLRLLCDKLPPTVDVLPPNGEFGPDVPPTATTLAPFPLRDVAMTLFGQHAAARLASVEPSIERGVESTFMVLVDGANTVRFHLDAAIAELGQAAEDAPVPEDVLQTARDFALGGIERTADNVEAFAEAVGAELDVHVRDIERVLSDAVDRLSAIVRRCDPREATVLLGGGEAPPAAEERPGPVQRLRAALARRPTTRHLARRIGERIGLAPAAEVLLGAAEANLTDGAPPGIPETYARLFLPAPVGMETLFVPRPEEMATLEAAVKRWLGDQPTAVLIAAPAGIGRRSLLERALRTTLSEFPSQRRRIGARVTSERDALRELSRLVGSQRDLSEEELRAKLSSAGRTVRVVEDAHRLYLPHPATLGGMERFLSALAESGPHVLWIVTVEAHARAQLDILLRFSDVFTHVIEMRAFDRAATERLVMARHHVSGAGLRFLPPSGRRRTQEQLQRALFDGLYRGSGGHPTLALFLWLRALRRWDEEGSVVEVAVTDPPRFDFLGRLEWERLLDLKRLLLFGAMTPAGFAMAHRVPVPDAEMRLRALERAALVRQERVGHEVRFSLNAVLVHPLTLLLEERNLL